MAGWVDQFFRDLKISTLFYFRSILVKRANYARAAVLSISRETYFFCIFYDLPSSKSSLIVNCFTEFVFIRCL